jgi:phosphohistidine phosphatase
MKTLCLIRHAKSSWDDPELEDFERPLNDRGLRDSPIMGKRLFEYGFRPDKIISSPAFRAQSTARRISRELAYPTHEIACNTAIYEASLNTLVSMLRSLNNDWNHVMLVGHNPGMHELVHYLMLKRPEDFPTCAIAVLQLEIEQWQDLRQGAALQLHFDYPKSV